MLLARELGDMHKVYLAKAHGNFNLSGFPSETTALHDTEGPLVSCKSSLAPGAVDGDANLHGDVICRLPLKVEKHRPNQPLTAVVDLSEGKPATTIFRRLRCCKDGSSLILCRLLHGRTHQIRVHLAALGFPIAGDLQYGCPATGTALEPEASNLNDAAMCLHAAVYAIGSSAGATNGEALEDILPRQSGNSSKPTSADLWTYCSRRPTWAE